MQLIFSARKSNFVSMASLPGLEPGTYCLEGSCSILLSYRDEERRGYPLASI